jgi:hypothetical protein
MPSRPADDRIDDRGGGALDGPCPDLLAQFAPVLRYDSGERWFAVAAGAAVPDEDRVYGHAAAGSDGRRWLQYWFYYRWNDPRLLGSRLAVGVHEGDWEMIQLRLDAAGLAPDLAVYAQHSHVTAHPWDTTPRDGSRAVVFVGRGSHASYFRRGWHWTGAWLERADGRGRAVDPALSVIDDSDPAYAWVNRPGRWGATLPRTGWAARLGLAAASPHGPGHQRQWRDPAVLLNELHR